MPSIMHTSLLMLAAGLSGLAQAWVTRDTLSVCTSIYDEFPDKLVWDPLGPKGLLTILSSGKYNTAINDYWNAASNLNRPACAFFPGNAQDVSFAVNALNEYPSVKFALKGGGHNPNLGFSSVKEGVLFAFRPNSQYAIPSADGKTIDVGAGCKWEDVYGALAPLGKTVTGGRLGDVGAMGLTLGGGLSYLSGQHGFACDNVVDFQVVLANGTITNANAASNPELFFALCGGGNQYAIVAKMTYKTFDSGVDGKIWGGTRTYGALQRSAILAAVANFTSNNKDPKAGIIPTFNFASVLAINIPFALFTFFYDGPEPPANVFAAFDDIKTLSDNTQTRDFLSLSKEIQGGDMKGLRFRIGVNSFPCMPHENMTSFLNDHYELVKKQATKAAIIDLLDFKGFSFAVQPMPRLITQASKNQRGGKINALGLIPENGDKVWIEYDLLWLNPLCDELCANWLRETVQLAHNLHVEKYSGIYPTNYESGDLEFLSYNPIFMNDALAGQSVLKSYGQTNWERLQAVHKAYDPKGLLSTRQGGFKFTD